MSVSAGRPWVLAEATWAEVAGTRYEVAILPWGATEAHNRHLPYATDSIQSEAVAVAAAELAWQAGSRVVVLPTVPLGVNTGQLEIPFCLNLNPTTQTALLRDLLRSLEGKRPYEIDEYFKRPSWSTSVMSRALPKASARSPGTCSTSSASCTMPMSE